MSSWRLAVVALAACGGAAEPWTPLFNGVDLDGWYSWLPSRGRDNDSLGVFRVDDGMIHILGVDLAPGQFELGYLSTTATYADFRARFEYRWGARNFVGWGPDSGFFIHVVGPDMIWPRAVECQVMAGDTGSVYLFDYATLETTIDPAVVAPTYLESGAPYTAPRNQEPNYARVTRDTAFDSLSDWNAVEVRVWRDTAEFIVNGRTTFRSSHIKQPSVDAPDDPTRDVALTRGRLLLQQEGAEIYYRNLEIQPLSGPLSGP